MPSWDDVLAPHYNVVTRKSGDELVVVVPERGKFVVLNATGALVLHLADGTRTIRDIADAIAKKFGVDVKKAELDILNFADSLVERGVLISVKHQTG